MFNLSKRKSLSQQATVLKRSTGVLTTHKQKESGFELNASLRPTNQASMGVGNLPVTLDMNPTLSGFLFNKEEKNLVDIYKDIYYYDIIAGTAADLLSTLPFSDFSLRGLDSKMERPYLESLERLNIHTLLPEISIDYLVFGTFIGSLVFNKEKKIFVDIIPHDFKHCDIKDFPFYGVDPIINVNMPKDVVSILREDSERVNQIKSNYGSSLITRLCEGQIELEPLSTLYIPRRTMTSAEGTSYFRRILPIYFMEKNLYRGSLAESIKRLRSILHITAGDLDWEPSPEDLKFISELFINADNDPIGAIVATRNGVNTNEIRCLSGDARISTDRGLIKIKDMVNHDPEHLDENTEFDTNILAKGADGNYCEIENWWYQGYKRTFELTTESGFCITATENHKIISIKNGSYCALPISQVVKNTWTLHDTFGCLDYSDKKVPLNYVASELLKYDNDPIKFPQNFDTSLAYVLGFILRSGKFIDDTVTCSGTNAKMKLFGQFFFDCFAIRVKFNSTYTEATIASRAFVGFLKYLGLINHNKKTNDIYQKELPELLFVSDYATKVAFALAYFNDAKGILLVDTTSDSIAKGIQTILADIGIFVRRTNKTLCITRENLHSLKNNKADTAYIPVAVIMQTLTARRAMRSALLKTYLDEKTYLDDEGNRVELSKSETRFLKYFYALDTVAYENIEVKYAKILHIVRIISKKFYNTLLLLIRRKPKFERVVSLQKGKKEHVYDLTMSSTVAPVFVADGILVKNSGGDFWKIEDMWNSTIPAKLKALNLSEQFINGESSVQTMEGSMSGFVEQLRSYRSMLTRKTFYDKLFPLISLTNEFYIDDNAKAEAQKLRSKRNVDLSTLLYQMQDTSSLAIPQVLWEKNLKPEGDSNYLEILKSMTEAGVPVPIRTMAAAGGIKLERVLKEQEEDLATRKKIIDYNKKIAALAPKPAGGSDSEEYDGYASAIANAYANLPEEHKKNLDASLPTKEQIQKSKRPTFIKRFENMGQELLHGHTPTGKKKHIFRQAQAQNEVNGKIAQAMQNLQKAGKLL